MSFIERQVQAAKHRLWVNRWLRQWGWWLLYATAAWTLLLIAERLFSLKLPIRWAALGAAGLSLIGSIVRTAMTRERDRTAAAALDEAAGLKERVSSGLYVWNNAEDPFAQAVVADAQQAIAGLSAKKFIPIRWPGSLSLSAMMVVVALLSLLLPEFDLLKKKEARANVDSQQKRLNQVRVAVAKPVSAIEKLAESNPDPAIDKEVKALQDALKKDGDHSVVRRETAKQLDRLEDALKNKADSEKFKALSETKNRLKQLGEPQDPKGELSKLMESMASGDFKEAQNQVKKAQEQLAKHARDGSVDPKKIEQMQKQLEEMSKKLEKAAEDKQSERDLKNAGLNEKEIQRAMEALAKKDPKEIEKLAKELAQRLKDQGMTKEQMEKMLNKIQERQQACKQMQGMADKMGQAAKSMESGDTKSAGEQLGETEKQLSEMEQMEQQLNEMQAQMSQIDEARDNMNDDDDHKDGDGKCKKCHGTGFCKDGSLCPECQGSGQNGKGRGKGRGPGARDRDDSDDVNFQNKKEKTQERKGGTIIGQQFVKSKQLKNKSEAELYDAAKAAEIDATDSLDRERIPRIYRKGVRTYFDRLGDQFHEDGSKKTPTSAPAANR